MGDMTPWEMEEQQQRLTPLTTKTKQGMSPSTHRVIAPTTMAVAAIANRAACVCELFTEYI
jgi:hypothetical protein